MKKTEELQKQRLVRKRIIGWSIFSVVVIVILVALYISEQKAEYADYSKTKLQEFVKVWEPIEKTNDRTIESDINTLNEQTAKIKGEISAKQEPLNSDDLKNDTLKFFDYASTFTSEMHRDFQWSKTLSEISIEDDQAIAGIDSSGGISSLQSTLKKAIATMDKNVQKLDGLTISKQVLDAHKTFRDSVAEESGLYSKLLVAVKSGDESSMNSVSTEIKVFNEKFGEMSGPSSALTIAYTIKTKEFEIKIEKLGKEIDNASTLILNLVF